LARRNDIKISKLRDSSVRTREQTIEQIRDLASQGKSRKEIAYSLGISQGYVSSLSKKQDIDIADASEEKTKESPLRISNIRKELSRIRNTIDAEPLSFIKSDYLEAGIRLSDLSAPYTGKGWNDSNFRRVVSLHYNGLSTNELRLKNFSLVQVLIARDLLESFVSEGLLKEDPRDDHILRKYEESLESPEKPSKAKQIYKFHFLTRSQRARRSVDSRYLYRASTDVRDKETIEKMFQPEFVSRFKQWGIDETYTDSLSFQGYSRANRLNWAKLKELYEDLD